MPRLRQYPEVRECYHRSSRHQSVLLEHSGDFNTSK